ncbi:MAG TPA: GGDEF domain-containing protein [Aquabacterium sp.]|nr:GGDEF domain-containing protein [Aquabacterium sp.]
MEPLHAPTLFVTVIVVMATAASLMTFVGLVQRTYRGFWWWVLAQWLNLAGALCLVFKEQSPLAFALSVVLGLQWPITMLAGLRRFYVRSELPVPSWGDSVVLAGAFLWWVVIWGRDPDDAGARVAAFTMSSITCYLYAAWMVWSIREWRQSAHLKAFLTFLVVGIVVQIPRLLEGLRHWGHPVENPNAFVQQPFLVLVLTVGVIFAVYMGLLLTYERTEQDLRESQRQLRMMVDFDMLTQLPNRRHFQDMAQQTVRLSPPGACALMLFDIDHFKSINEKHGHAAGDSALRLVSSVARTMLRGRDLVGRMGGDQFVALLPDTATQDALRVASRMARQIEQKQADSTRETIRLSAGIVQVQEQEPLDKALHRAIEALAEAKRQGRGRVVSADTSPEGNLVVIATRTLGSSPR